MAFPENRLVSVGLGDGVSHVLFPRGATVSLFLLKTHSKGSRKLLGCTKGFLSCFHLERISLSLL